MARNKISDLRDHLFETIEQLNDPDKPMEIARAKAIAGVAQTIINSAKVEVDMAKALNASRVGSAGFFGLPPEEQERRPLELPGGTRKKANGAAAGRGERNK
jgi:hypothetical protein